MEFSLDYLKRWLSAHRRERIDIPALVACAILIVWFLGVIITPYLLPANSVNFGNNGLVGAADNTDEITGMGNAIARFYYNAGDANCHQRSNRSFFLNDNQLPFCARDVSIFLGLAIGAALLIFLSLELHIFWILLGLVPMALDGGIQLFTSYESTNLMRFLTGILAGIVTGIALGYIVSEIGMIVVFKRQIKKAQ